MKKFFFFHFKAIGKRMKKQNHGGAAEIEILTNGEKKGRQTKTFFQLGQEIMPDTRVIKQLKILYQILYNAFQVY